MDGSDDTMPPAYAGAPPSPRSRCSARSAPAAGDRTQSIRKQRSYHPAVTSERRWGQPLWVWRAFALSTVPPIVFLLFSLTVSGRAFAVMVLIAEAFAAIVLFMGWARAERARFE